MSVASNKEAIRRLMEEGVNAGNEKVIDELVASNFTTREEGELRPVGLQGFKQLAADFRTAFPDGRFVIEDLVAEGETVVYWGYFTGTHQGPLEGIPPTGKPVKVKDVDLFRFENGKIVETWTHFDQPGMMMQLGVLGGPEEER
ncbi:MAG TPA: ester cyclase [Anaerolineales bacterium]|nr:ester cyclase [Anaerolineales bacterium]